MDVPSGKIRTVADILEEPHVQLRQILEEVNYPEMGPVKTVKTLIFSSGKPPEVKSRAPILGEHTGEVLRELANSDEEIRELIEKKVALQWRD